MTMVRKWWLLALVLALIAASCTTSKPSESTTTSISGPIPPPGQAAPPEPPQIIPLLRTTNRDSPIVGQTVFLTSQVLAASPIGHLELWVNGELVDSVAFEEPVQDPTFAWQWQPTSAGLQATMVRAFDTEGKSADSFYTWIRTQPGTDVNTGEPRTGIPQSPLEIASDVVSVDIPACEATVAVASAQASAGMTVAASTLGVAGNRAIAVLPPEGGSVAIPMTSSPVIVSVSPYDEEALGPSILLVVPGASDCSTGTWEGDVAFDGGLLVGADGLEVAYLYVSGDDSTWSRLPDIGIVSRGPDGFNFSDVLPSVAAGATLEVEAWGWDGGSLIGLGRGKFIDETPPSVEQTWGVAPQPFSLYTSLAIVRRTGRADTSGILDETLLSTDVLCPKTYSLLACGPNPASFRWTAGSVGADAGLVQVSSGPPPSGPATDFPGLLWTSMIERSEDQFQLDFSVPLGKIWNAADPANDTPASTGDGTLDFSSLSWMMSNVGNAEPSPPPGADPSWNLDAQELVEWTDSPQDGSTASGSGGDGSQKSAGAYTFAILPLAPTELWVRVLPFSGGQPVGAVSNPVSFLVDTNPEGITVVAPQEQRLKAAVGYLFDINVDFSPPKLLNEEFAHCVRVVENPFGKENPVYGVFTAIFQSQFDDFRDKAEVWTATGKQATGLVPGATVCAEHPDPPDAGVIGFLEDAVSFIADVWDTFKGLIDMVKNGIIEGIVDIVGCEPKDTCITALKALADVGLAAIGVPPTLPSFNEFMEAAKGNLAGALAEQLVGQVCGDVPCAEFAKVFVEDAIDDIQSHFSEMTVTNAASGGYQLLLNPGIKVVPEPAGQLFPAAVKVTFTRNNNVNDDPEEPIICGVSLVTNGVGSGSWTDKLGIHHEKEKVSGIVFAPQSTSADLSNLEPGQSLVVGVSGLDFDRVSYLAGTEPHRVGYASKERLKSLEIFTASDAVFTTETNVCEFRYQETNTRSGLLTTPADIP